MEIEPWKQYFDDFRSRSERIPPDAFDRGALLYEAAHDTYQSTTDRLTAAGWDAERALVVGRLFGTVVKEWLDRDGRNVDGLERALRTHYQSWTGGRDVAP
ncbi:MAG: hypothetical protein ACT443_04070 [Gemmatimonadota bacterium]